LLVVWHWNSGGQGSGASRFTGAGAFEWGRFLGSAKLERRAKDADGATLLQTRYQFVGSEIPDFEFRIRRRVWADDPGDLDSDLNYTVEVTESEDGAPELGRTQTRVIAALNDQSNPSTVQVIGDRLAADGNGPPLKRRTIQDALDQLAGGGLADATPTEPGMARVWWRS